jgi:hypothetical protein
MSPSTIAAAWPPELPPIELFARLVHAICIGDFKQAARIRREHVAEALTFVPGVWIEDDGNGGRKLVGNQVKTD